MNPTPGPQRYCTFRVADLELAIDVMRVQEVLREAWIRPVPLAPPSVLGLVNLRGQVVTVLDLRTRLGLGDDGRPEHPMYVVVQTDDALVSIVVDQAGDVVQPAPDTHAPLPGNLSPRLHETALGLHRHDGRVFIVLDLGRLLDLPGGGS
jgi:purine-binding chemotaxis protein CheW